MQSNEEIKTHITKKQIPLYFDTGHIYGPCYGTSYFQLPQGEKCADYDPFQRCPRRFYTKTFYFLNGIAKSLVTIQKEWRMKSFR